jgi:hypothetical protein
MNEFERCPRCRKKLAGYSVYQCPACRTEFCCGCEQEDLSATALGWLAAAAVEVDLASCPVCTAPIADEDQIGGIARPNRDK